MLYFLLSIIALSKCNAFTDEYWQVKNKGFLPENKADSCINYYLKDFCNILSVNSTTEEIDYEASKISMDKLLYEDYYDVELGTMMESFSQQHVIEDTFHWFAIATCQIGHNQNPSGEYTGIPIVIPNSVSTRLLFLASYLRREPTTGYSSLVLDNCVNVNGFNNEYEDWKIQRTVTPQTDKIAHRAEKGFYASHCAVIT